MRLISIIFVAISLSSCGSLTTLGNSDQKISANLKRKSTHCESIPRVYSGVAYDLCNLHSTPEGIYIDWFLGLYLVDCIASGVVDTAVLPYTGYKQYKYGGVGLD